MRRNKMNKRVIDYFNEIKKPCHSSAGFDKNYTLNENEFEITGKWKIIVTEYRQ